MRHGWNYLNTSCDCSRVFMCMCTVYILCVCVCVKEEMQQWFREACCSQLLLCAGMYSLRRKVDLCMLPLSSGTCFAA